MANVYIADQGQANAPENNLKKTIQPVPRQLANLEAEKGEVVVGDLVGVGVPQSYIIGGKRHSEGGSPLNLEDGSFIFSDTNDMKFKKKQDADILAMFGEKETKTPADIAKKYDMNEFVKILMDPNSDQLDKETAEMNLENYQEKLGLLALAQEAKKGFPDGIPDIAMPVAQKYGIDPLVQKVRQMQENASTQPVQEYAEGGELEKAQVGKYVKSPTDNDDNYYYFFDPKSGKYYKIPKDQWRAVGTNDINVIEGEDMSDVVSGQTYYIPGQGFVKANSVEWERTSDDNIELPKAGQNTYSTSITHEPSKLGQIVLENALRQKFDSWEDYYNSAQKEKNDAFFASVLGSEINYLINDQEYNYNDGDKKVTEKGLQSTSKHKNYWVEKDTKKGHKGYNILGDEHLSKLQGIKDGNGYGETVIDDFLKVNALNLELVNYLDNDTARKELKDQTDFKDNQKGIKEYLEGLNDPNAKKLAEQVGELTPEQVANFQLVHVAMDNLNKNEKMRYIQDSPGVYTNNPFYGKLGTFSYGEPEEMLGNAFTISKIGSIYGDNTSRQINVLNWLGNNNIELKANPHWTPIAPVEPPVYDDTIVSHNNDLPAPYFMQDLNNLGLAARNRAHVKKYTPWQAPLHYEPYRPVFTDFRGAAARNSAMLNTALNTAAMFGPEAFVESFNRMAGKASANIGELQEYEDKYNTQVDNEARKINYHGYNEYLGKKSAWDTNLFDKYTIANQQYDNEVAKANADIINTFNNAITNRADQYSQNSLFPNYWIDPRSGGMLRFKGNQGSIRPSHQGDLADEFMSFYDKLQKAYPGQVDANDAMNFFVKANGLDDDDEYNKMANRSLMNARNRNNSRRS